MLKILLKITVKAMLVLLVLIVTLVIATFIVIQQPQFGNRPEGYHLDSIRNSPQHNGKKFENPGKIDVHMGFSSLTKVALAYWNAPEDRAPSKPVPVLHPDVQEIDRAPDSVLMVTWFGHSTFLIEMEGKVLMLDPMLGPASSPFAFMTKRFSSELAITPQELPYIDAVLFSHDHYDHLDYPTILALKDKVGHFYVPLGLGSHLQRWGVDSARITEMDWWDETSFEGLTFACTPAQHFSGRSVNDRNCTLWASWAIVGKHRRVYFSGDSGYFPGFKRIGSLYGPFDIALVECGQYNELWSEIHMMPEETAQTCLDVRSKALMPIHWGMFNLSLHPWTEPVERVSKAASELGVQLVTPRIGQRFALGGELPQDRWWAQ